MFGHGWVVVVVDWLDEGTVELVWLVGAALATTKPIPMLRPKAPPARARVVIGLFSFILFTFLGNVSHDSRPRQPWSLLRPSLEIA